MELAELQRALKTTAPALAKTDLIPVTQDFCFLPDRLFTYNDVLAISVDGEFGISGAIAGDRLLRVVDSWKGGDDDEVKITQKKQSTTFSCKRNRLRLTTVDAEEFVFEMPDPEDAEASMEVDKQFLEAVSFCLMSVSSRVENANMKGVTVKFGEGTVTIFATDRGTISRYVYETEVPENIADRYIFPDIFCQAVVRLAGASKSKEYELLFFDDSVILDLKDGTLVYSRIIDEAPPEFEVAIQRSYGDMEYEDMAPIPDEFVGAIGRASFIVGDNGKCHVAVEDGKMSIKTVSGDASTEIEDDLDFENHEDIEAKINAGNVLKGAKSCVRVSVLGRCTAFANDNGLFLSAHSPGS